VWQLFEQSRASVEQERSHVQAHRERDEFRYAGQYNLAWPLMSAAGTAGAAAVAAPSGSPRPSGSPAPSALPSPSPVPSAAPPLGYDYFFFGGPGGTTC
jgi:hypothetical protein